MKHINSVRTWHSADVQKKSATLRDRVFEALTQRPMTGSELNRELGSPSAHKRLSELRDLGAIREAEDRACAVSGQLVTSWEACAEVIPKARGQPERSDDLRVGFDQLVELIRHAQREMGYVCPPELRKLGAVLRKKYGG